MQHPGRTACLAVLLVAALAACSAASDSSSGRSTAAGTAPPGRGAAAPAVAAGPAPAGVGGAAAVRLPRDVVRTATMAVQVPDVRAAADRALALAVGAGGGLTSENAAGGSDELALQVAPDRLAATLDALARLGHETGRTVSSSDVTGQVADVGSRLAAQQASVDRVRALFGQAGVIADVVAIESQLTQRESDLESLQAQAKDLQGQLDLATITLSLNRPPQAAAATFSTGLSAGLTAFLHAARGGAVVLGALLPFLPLLLLGAWLIRRTRRPAGTS